MISFSNDYSECAHPLILKNLAEHCYEQNPGYGEDRHCKAAADLIDVDHECDLVLCDFLSAYGVLQLAAGYHIPKFPGTCHIHFLGVKSYEYDVASE